MQVHKFFITTRRGKVVKTVREHYLRSDIYCGLNECKQCKRGYVTSALEVRALRMTDLSRTIPSHSCRAMHRHRRWSMASICLYWTQRQFCTMAMHWRIRCSIMRLFCTQAGRCDFLTFYLFTRSSLQEVRRRSGVAYKRLHDQVFSRQAAWYIFDNEHQPDCYVEHDETKRSSEQRNRELVYAAAVWYQKHCKEVRRR